MIADSAPGGLRAVRRLADRLLAADLAVLGGLVALAAALRLPGLEARGPFSYDQGGDMLVLRAFTQDGVIPLLGPKASVGDFHHGAFTFDLLAPAAWLSGSDPFAVTLEMALIGIAAVAAVWWLGRVMGGRVVALAAGLLFAVSPAAVDESIFIWNPNPIPLFAAVSAGAAWRGHRTGRGRWWVLALGSAGVVAQLHFLGLLFLVPIVGLLLLDLVRAPSGARGALWRGLAGGLGLIAVLYVPLALHELQSGFSETQAILAYLGSGSGTAPALPTRVIVTTLRLVGWPFVGLVTEVPVTASIALVLVASLLIWLALRASGPLAEAGRWIGASLLWFVIALSVVAPTLANVVPGLPNDHYHAFADPLLVVGAALAGAALVRAGVAAASRPSAAVVTRVALVGLLAVAIGVALSREPGPDPNGGWPTARAAGQRIVATTGSVPVSVDELPIFEPGDGIAFPIVAAGGVLAPDPIARYLVVGCDRLFTSIIGQACGGPAESRELERLLGVTAPTAALVDRFDLGVQWSVSVYDLGR